MDSDPSRVGMLPVQIVSVCISHYPETWNISELPFYNYTEGWKPFQHEKTKDRIAYLAERRNRAVSNALELFPDAKYILMIDSYYVRQGKQIRSLVDRYNSLLTSAHPGGCILGASTWIFDRTRMLPRHRFYDGWTTPEALNISVKTAERLGGVIPVGSVGGCYLYPRGVWEKTPYSVPGDLHGCEHNWLCEHSGLPVFLSLDERLWREPITYSWMKRFRVSLHLRRFLRRGL